GDVVGHLAAQPGGEHPATGSRDHGRTRRHRTHTRSGGGSTQRMRRGNPDIWEDREQWGSCWALGACWGGVARSGTPGPPADSLVLDPEVLGELYWPPRQD